MYSEIQYYIRPNDLLIIQEKIYDLNGKKYLTEAKVEPGTILAGAIINELQERFKDGWYEYLTSKNFDVEEMMRKKNVPVPDVSKDGASLLDLLVSSNNIPEQSVLDKIAKMSDSQIDSYSKSKEVVAQITNSADAGAVKESVQNYNNRAKLYPEHLKEILKKNLWMKGYLNIDF